MSLDSVLLLEAVNFAADKHRNQRRKDPDETPYINHPIGMLMRCELLRLILIIVKLQVGYP